MDRIERLEHNFMEPDPYWESPKSTRPIEVIHVHHLMPDDEEARRRMASAIRRSPTLRCRVEVDLALREGIEARERYPEAYLMVRAGRAVVC
jgi:hypothetical protein